MAALEIRRWRRLTVAVTALSTAAVSAPVGCGKSGTKPESRAEAPPPPPASGVRFVDVTPKAGITFRHQIPGKRPINILQSMGGGCGFLDFDRDGNLDVLFLSQEVALYRGDGRGNFVDVTTAAGLGGLKPGWWMGCAAGDYDNDGFPDLYLSAYRGGVLLHNEGGKGFRDVTRQAGIGPQPWGTACTFGDYDNDGKLDLFVGNYVKFGPDSVQLCKVKDFETSCSPTVYDAERPTLLRNEGGGRFRDVSEATGIASATGKVLGAIWVDADSSGRQSLYLANDEVPSDFFQNLGGGRFKNNGEIAGLAYIDNGKPYGGMGVSQGDINADGKPDIAVGTFTLENKLLFINQGGGLFEDRSPQLGVAQPGLPYLSFGTRLFDVDNDGHLDLMLANGYIADNVAGYEPARTYREPTLLFRNENGARYADASKSAGVDLQRAIVGRGLAVGDYDNDGRVDALVVDGEGPPLLLHNETDPAANWLSLRLEGVRANRDGYGAVVTVEAGGRKFTRVCHADGSYLSTSDPRVHVGIGDATSAKVTVRWPGGGTDSVNLDAVNRPVTVRQKSVK